MVGGVEFIVTGAWGGTCEGNAGDVFLNEGVPDDVRESVFPQSMACCGDRGDVVG